MTSVLVGGDVCPVHRGLPLFSSGRVEEIFGDLLPLFEHASLAVINLECCLLPAIPPKPISKDGPALGVPGACINGIKDAHISVVNLANNHCLDYGPAGLRSTIETCAASGIAHFGAGNNLEDAGRILIREIDGIRIGFLGLAEHEFSIAGKYSPGANPLDIINIYNVVRKHREDIDFLIVLLHGGKEYYSYPTPALMKTCHFLVDQGAGAVICQHSHCPGCYEMYNGAPIVYGQGNLVFDRPKAPAGWHEGFLVKLSLDINLKCSLDLVPYHQFHEKSCVELMKEDEMKDFLKILAERTRRLQEKDFVDREWEKYCMQEKYSYFSRLYGYNRLLRVLNRKMHFSDWFYSEKKKLMVRNVVECETHREVLEKLWRDEKTPEPLRDEE